ncbi:hybrid sensor histidine kinase/response regulator transcription factor [Viscerimonas tarda]
MKIKHINLFLFFIAVFSLPSLGQPKCFFEHYGVEDGLPQNSIMDIMQDSKDFMWFSTWNGLCKFDGYNFYTYLIQQGDKQIKRSNRIDLIREDKYGYIWTLPYDREPLRFDPSTEKFVGLEALDEYKNLSFTGTNIITAKSGKVWLLSNEMGCICVLDSTFSNTVAFNSQNGKIHANKIYTVYEDENLNSWILTDNGLYLFSANGEKVNDLFFEKENPASQPAQNFYSVMELKNQIWFSSDNGRIWIYDKKDELFTLLEVKTTSKIHTIRNINDTQALIATGEDGFFIYNLSLKTFEKYNMFTLPGMRSNEIISCYIDRAKNIWLELNCFGVSKFDLESKTIKHFEMKIESKILNVFPPNFYMLEDKENRLWVHPRGGGFSLYDAANDELVPFYNELFSPSWRFSNVVQVAFSDRQGNLWLSTRSHGLEKIIFNNDVFNSTIVDNDVYSTINNDIRAMLEDDNQNLWVSTKGEKIYVYDRDRNNLGYLCQSGRIDGDTPLTGICYCIMQDADKNIWIGTKGEGLYKLTPTEDPEFFKIKQFKNSPTNLYSLSSNNVYSIFQDKKRRIWVGTYDGGLNLVEDGSERFINYKNNLKNYPTQYGSQIRIISADKYGNICVGTTLGLIMFSPNFKSVNQIAYKSYIKVLNDKNSLGGNDVYDICTTRNGDTYIATFGGGVNRIIEVGKDGFPTKFTSYGVKDGLPSDVILTIVEDSKSRLWIATEGNLTRFDPDKNSFETYSEVSRLIKGQTFSENARCVAQSGQVFFGFSKGFITIDPDKVNTNTFKPYIALTKLKIANQDVAIGEDSPLKENIDNINYIKLDHTQNFISIEFVALDYLDPQRIIYAYKLDEFDKDWIIGQKQRTANYTNLSPGSYTFRVKSTNSDGIWMENEHILKIEITPSFWQTGWAYLLYTLLIGVAAYVVLNIFFSFYRLENKVKLEYEQTEMKTRFFTDISHEIRTPLTMIVSPVEHILENEKIPEEIRTQLQLVLKNANRMLRMVNQILDFRKIQKKDLNIQETVIAPFVREICNNFQEIAEERRINLIINNQIGDEKLWIDRDSFEKLLFNLLSNAFKYTQSDKTIEVSLSNEKRDNAVALTVRDQGKGMSKEILNKLFTRFASFNKDKNKPSTGIGLSIVKEVADKHHAKILVESEITRGSCFTVLFNKGANHFKDDQGITFVHEQTQEQDVLEDAEQADLIEEIAAEDDTLRKKDRQLILVVEDDEDLRRFITTMLHPHYNVLEAPDGKVGYDLAIKKNPDFIVSDIMMPEIDGVELLRRIRANGITSHIPFILLTAKSNMESKIDGLEYGADDYITKPFSVKYLRARIDNIILQRQRLYRIFKDSDFLYFSPLEDKHEDEHTITSRDELFLQKVRAEVENNIDDSNFLIDNLVVNLGMSRTVFFKKLKSLIGISPIDFIRDIKIKHAAKLLDTHREYTVKEVSFMIGMLDVKYFTRCFKAIVGMTPTEYRNLKKRNG